MEQPILHSTPEERNAAHAIVAEELGSDFVLHFDIYPHNKGVKGDEGVFGETVELEGHVAEPVRFLAEEHEILARVSSMLCNEVEAITKVVYNIGKADEDS